MKIDKDKLGAIGCIGKAILWYLSMVLIAAILMFGMVKCSGDTGSSGGYVPDSTYDQGDYLLEKARP